MSLPTQALPLTAQQEEWYAKACAQIDTDQIRDLILNLVSIHSPTGAEAEASRFMVEHMNKLGIAADYQQVNPLTGNAIGRVQGDGDGATLLLYAPLDTHLEADEAKDLPWAGRVLRDDMKPEGYLYNDDIVIGLGASNPKSMVATLTEAVRCVVKAGIPLKGNIVLAFAGGGMPWEVPERNHYGVSSGVTHMLTHGVSADFGIIMKPWNEVYYEHPGMCWFKVTVWGTLGYSGITRGTPGFDSSIVPAAKLILELEEWLPQYTRDNTTTQITPEGWIAAVRSGWPEKPAFPSAATEIYLDMRCNPYVSTAQVSALFDAAMRRILAKHPEIKAEWQMTASCPGSHTAPDHWIVQSAQRAWERQEGRAYPGAAKLGGQTDAAAINKLGIPLVRIGYPWIGDKDVPEDFNEGLGGMGVACVSDLVKTCRQVIYSIIDSLTRPHEQVLNCDQN